MFSLFPLFLHFFLDCAVPQTPISNRCVIDLWGHVLEHLLLNQPRYLQHLLAIGKLSAGFCYMSHLEDVSARRSNSKNCHQNSSTFDHTDVSTTGGN
jgi:hypothetical protein